MRARIRSFLFFALTVIAVLVVLTALNRVPLLQQGTLRTYASVEAVRAKLHIRDLRVPAYFPQDVTWPPAEIWAQTQPYRATLLVFNRAGLAGPVLVISQTAAGRAALDDRIRIREVTESVPYDLKGRKALLLVGRCGRNEVCSRVSWDAGDSSMIVAMKSPPFALLRIAESMAP